MEQPGTRPRSETGPVAARHKPSCNTGIPGSARRNPDARQDKRMMRLHPHGLRATAEADLRLGRTPAAPAPCNVLAPSFCNRFKSRGVNTRPISSPSPASRRANNAHNS